jgi:hypothetical protein
MIVLDASAAIDLLPNSPLFGARVAHYPHLPLLERALVEVL